jgi:hypothetical protein
MFDLFIVSDIARTRVRDQFEGRPRPRNRADTVSAERVGSPRKTSTEPRRLLASLRAVADR